MITYMKNLLEGQLVRILIIMNLLICVVSCSGSIDEEEVLNNEPPCMVGVTTRSIDESSYPLNLYAFYSETGILAGCATAKTASDILTIALRLGSYHLVAMSGINGLESVTSPVANQGIGIPTNGLITSAVQMGRADIIVSDQNVSADLTMSYQVAQVSIELHDIPTDVTAVSVSLSSLYTNETFSGTLSTPKAIAIPLSKGSDGVWKSGIVYTLPGSTTQLTLSINMTNAAGSKTYGYTHATNLIAGTPYTLIGSYIEGFNFTSGTISAAGWNEQQTINFTFGLGAIAGADSGSSNVAVKDDDLPDDSDGAYWVTEIPSAISIWNGHFIGLVTNSNDTSADLLLISLCEWETIPANAITLADKYSEGNITDWRIPTEAEMLVISSWGKFTNNNCQLTAINGALNSYITNNDIEGGKSLTNSGEYLCGENGTKVVKLSTETVNTASTSSTAQYRLRLVKSITVKQQ